VNVRVWVAAGWVLTAVAAATVGAAAARQTVRDPAATPNSSSSKVVLYTVKTGNVGRSLTFSATAEWPTVRTVSTSASGTVTSVALRPGSLAGVGSVLFTVNLRPVFLAAGSVPSFRNLTAGDEGTDVAQLQTYLTTMGYQPGTIDGTFGPATVAAVKAWQDNWDQPATGRVKAGDFLYLPRVPARLAMAQELTVGATVTAGQPALTVLGPTPDFSIVLTSDQADLVPTSGKVTVRGPHRTWPGRITSSSTSQTGDLVLGLSSPRNGPLCATTCASVPVGEPQLYPATIVLVPRRTGPLVPVAAIHTSPSGSTSVTMADGTGQRVKVLAAADGRAVVRGIKVGDHIRLFG